MRLKHLVFAVVIVLGAALLSIAPAQGQKSDVRSQKSEEIAKTTPAKDATVKPPEGGTPSAPELKSEDLLKISRLQLQQAMRLIRRQDMEREYESLQKQIDENRNAIRSAVDLA